jgi:hypothetical protein
MHMQARITDQESAGAANGSSEGKQGRAMPDAKARIAAKGVRRFLIHGAPDATELTAWMARGMERVLKAHGHVPIDALTAETHLVLNFVAHDEPKSIRRRGRGTFSISIVEGPRDTENILIGAYPFLLRTLANVVLYVIARDDGGCDAHFITIEQGHYTVSYDGKDEEGFFARIYDRVMPLATSDLIIHNTFTPDLPEELWQGDEVSASVVRTGQRLDEMGLLPSPWPVHEIVSPRDFRHIQRLYGLGGLSYGNISARAKHDPSAYWMSASGVDKGKLAEIGRDVLLVTGYDPDKNAMLVSVPPDITPRRVSVDAIEHYMIYRNHPDIGGIVHVHSWWDGHMQSTEVNYPCGTQELAEEVSALVDAEPNPAEAIIGLKNHGLTITGSSLDAIIERVQGRLLPQVPMS